RRGEPPARHHEVQAEPPPVLRRLRDLRLCTGDGSQSGLRRPSRFAPRPSHQTLPRLRAGVAVSIAPGPALGLLEGLGGLQVGLPERRSRADTVEAPVPVRHQALTEDSYGRMRLAELERRSTREGLAIPLLFLAVLRPKDHDLVGELTLQAVHPVTRGGARVGGVPLDRLHNPVAEVLHHQEDVLGAVRRVVRLARPPLDQTNVTRLEAGLGAVALDRIPQDQPVVPGVDQDVRAPRRLGQEAGRPGLTHAPPDELGAPCSVVTAVGAAVLVVVVATLLVGLLGEGHADHIGTRCHRSPSVPGKEKDPAVAGSPSCFSDQSGMSPRTFCFNAPHRELSDSFSPTMSSRMNWISCRIPRVSARLSARSMFRLSITRSTFAPTPSRSSRRLVVWVFAT